MKELNESQIASVNGGLIPLVIALGFVLTHASEIEDAVNGFFQNLD